MEKKLEALTKEQEEIMYKTRDFWKDYVFSCKNTVNSKEAIELGLSKSRLKK